MLLTKTAILKMILALSAGPRIDPAIVASVVDVESKFNPNATGTIGERGLLQLHPKYFPGAEHYDPRLNIERGIAQLLLTKKHCPFQTGLQWVICYNRGISGAKSVQDPSNDAYFKKVSLAYQHYKNILQQQHAVGSSLSPSGKGDSPTSEDSSYRTLASQRPAGPAFRFLH